MRQVSLVSALLLGLLLVPQAGLGGPYDFYLIDQQQTTQNGSNNSGGGGLSARKGQTFTPSLDQVNLVEMLIAGEDDQFLMNIRDTDLQGSILGTSLAVTLPNPHSTSDPVQFYFPTAVPLAPGQTYAWELVPLYLSDGAFTVRVSLSDLYPGGVYYTGPGSPLGSSDAWFREGIATPEPSSLALVFLGTAVVVFCWRLRCWKVLRS